MPKASPARRITRASNRCVAGAAEDERVAEEHAEGGYRIQQHAAQQIGISKHSRGLLADAEEFGAQFVLHLGAVERVLDTQRCRSRPYREEAVLALDIVEFDGEAVRGGNQFLLGKQQRGRTALLGATSERFRLQRQVRG